MAPHSSTLAWKIPWMEEPGRLQSMGLQRVRHDSVISLSLSFGFQKTWCKYLENWVTFVCLKQIKTQIFPNYLVWFPIFLFSKSSELRKKWSSKLCIYFSDSNESFKPLICGNTQPTTTKPGSTFLNKILLFSWKGQNL